MLQKESFFRRPDPAPARGLMPSAPAPQAPAPQSGHDAPKPAANAEDRKEAKLIVGPDIKMKGVEVNDCDTLQVEEGAELSGEISVLDKAPSPTMPRRAIQ